MVVSTKVCPSSAWRNVAPAESAAASEPGVSGAGNESSIAPVSGVCGSAIFSALINASMRACVCSASFLFFGFSVIMLNTSSTAVTSFILS